MSRIHEALRKAQEERAANSSLAGQRTVEEVETQVVPQKEKEVVAPTAFVEPQLPSLTTGREGFSPETLRFENIIKNCSKPTWNLDPHTNIFCQTSTTKAGAEHFRSLRSRLAQIRETFPLKTVLVTSAISGEGKTFVAGNLAQAIARQRERRVLLIDGDLRRSRLHMPLGAPISPGLSEYLRGEAKEISIIQRGQDENFCFIPGGALAPEPSELLANGRFKALLERLTPV